MLTIKMRTTKNNKRDRFIIFIISTSELCSKAFTPTVKKINRGWTLMRDSTDVCMNLREGSTTRISTIRYKWENSV